MVVSKKSSIFAPLNTKAMDTNEIMRDLGAQLLSLGSLKKIMVVLGPRQVGKTTLLRQMTADMPDVLSFDCDNMDDRLALENKTKTELAALVGRAKTIIIDEAQRVRNIGMTLKMLGDLHLDAQIYVTGSSSLQLADDINEPATGRLLEFNLYPLSLSELAEHASWREENRLLEFRMIYGTYPEIVNHSEQARLLLQNIVNSYEKNKQLIVDYDAILEELNPALRADKEKDKVIQSLQDQVNTLSSGMKKILAYIAKDEDNKTEKP